MITSIDIVTEGDTNRLAVTSMVRGALYDNETHEYLSTDEFKITTIVTSDHMELVELAKEAAVALYPMKGGNEIARKIMKLLEERYGA